jgi:hypothetical protein
LRIVELQRTNDREVPKIEFNIRTLACLSRSRLRQLALF